MSWGAATLRRQRRRRMAAFRGALSTTMPRSTCLRKAKVSVFLITFAGVPCAIFFSLRPCLSMIGISLNVFSS